MHFLKDEFRFPEPLDRALVRHFWNGRLPAAAELKGLARGLNQLWPILAKERGQQATRHYSGENALADAYAAYYLPANAMKLPLILEEAHRFGVPLVAEATRWMDLGCGPGTAFWGLAWWAHHRGLNYEFQGLEQSAAFIKLAEKLSRGLLNELGEIDRAKAVHWKAYKHGKSSSALDESLRAFKPTVVSMMNSIAEMAPSGEERAKWLGELIASLARLAREDGKPRWIVIVEPGSKVSSRELHELRESVRSNADARIWLPCIDARPCGALVRPDDWCHEEAGVVFPKWMDTLGSAAGMRKESVLFSYLVLSVGVHPEPPGEWPSDGKRIVSQMMREKGLTNCFLCTKSGKARARVLNSRATEATSGFVESGKGTIFQNLALEEKGDVSGFEPWEGNGADSSEIFPRA